MSRSLRRSPTTSCAAKTDEFRAPDRRGGPGPRPTPRSAGAPSARRSTSCCPRRSPPSRRPAAAWCGRTWTVVGIPITWDMVPYDVQLIGGIMLHEGKIAEMATGEGKTLVATMPLYLNALDRPRRPPGHRERLPGAPRQRVDGRDLQVPRAHRRLHPARDGLRRAPRRSTPATSPTARTTSSASTTCATTWRCVPSTACSAASSTRSSTRSTRC